jgi:hypothetical protein
MSDYSKEFETAYTSVNTKKNLPELFCKLYDALQAIPPSAHTPDVKNSVKDVFQDVNTAVQQYNEQFQLLLHDLGILCQDKPGQKDKIKQFFIAFIDLLRLAYTVYKEDTETLQKFHPILQHLLHLLESNKIQLEQEEPFQNALLLQMINSSWALSNSTTPMDAVANKLNQQRGGHKTRKQRRV